MKNARYYPDTSPKVFTPVKVVKTHEDGTVDLADGKGSVIVTSCPVSSSPQVGHAVLTDEEAPASPPNTKPKKPTAS